MRKFFRLFFAIPILFGYYSVNAQYDSSLGNWEIFLLKGNFNKKVSFTGEFNIRANDFHSTYNYCEYKFSAGYSLKHNFVIGAGTGGYNTSFTGSFLNTIPSQKEFRFWLEAMYKHSWGRFYFDHRIRVERRFTIIGNTSRFRYRLGLNVPVTKPRLSDHTIYLAASNEIFIGQGHPSYEKNRFFAGAGYKLNDRFTFQVGNMNQNDYKGSYILSKNYLYLTFIYNLPNKTKQQKKTDSISTD
jgi:hypothetical protein